MSCVKAGQKGEGGLVGDPSRSFHPLDALFTKNRRARIHVLYTWHMFRAAIICTTLSLLLSSAVLTASASADEAAGWTEERVVKEQPHLFAETQIIDLLQRGKVSVFRVRSAGYRGSEAASARSPISVDTRASRAEVPDVV
jgi:hypothetical protein